MRPTIVSVGTREGSESIVVCYAPTSDMGGLVHGVFHALWQEGHIPHDCTALTNAWCAYHAAAEVTLVIPASDSDKANEYVDLFMRVCAQLPSLTVERQEMSSADYDEHLAIVRYKQAAAKRTDSN
jgi:hypothetical protein